MARHLARWELDGVRGPVVVVDVIRAFTTAAYAFGSGAAEIYLVGDVGEALAFKAAHPGTIALGEDRGLRPEGFDYPNSPAMVSRADLAGRTLVQRTSAGTRGVVAAVHADRLWAASLACASATARALNEAGIGEPAYVITGRFEDAPDATGHDDALAADLIERARLGRAFDAAATSAALLATDEAARTLALGPDHCDPMDIELAAAVDVFDFAMEVERTPYGLRLTPGPRREFAPGQRNRG
jgi:2-phosphosulfolactate phosphatase